MSEEVIIGPLAQIPPGEGRNFAVRGTRIAVFHSREGRVFATQPDCPHRGGCLSDGLLGGATLICPLHERAFDLATGACIGHAEKLLTYSTRVTTDGDISVTLTGSLGL
jgi:nitrite reductase (NADH) small subunit